MKKKLLLADDSITIQKVIAITFSSDDYLLTVVDNGDAALEKARSDRPDLILADVFMPGKNGYEVCAAVKQDPNLQGIPVLLLTGTFEPFDEGKARAAGADKWIAKPFESQSLIDCIENLLAGAASSAPKIPAPAPAAPTPVATPPERPVAPLPPVTAATVPAPPAPPVAAPTVPAAPVPPIGPVVPPPPVVPVLAAEPDPWGDAGAIDLDLSELGGDFGDAGTTPIIPTASDDDLWGAVSLEDDEVSAASINAASQDSWSLDDAIDMSAPVADLDVEPQISTPEEDLWGGLEAEAAGPDSGQIELDEFPTWEEETEILPMGDVEILEEEDIEPAQTPIFEEPIFAPPTAAPFDLEPVSDFGGDPMSGELQWDESALTAVPSAHGERAPVAPVVVPSPPVVAQAPLSAAPVQPPVAAPVPPTAPVLPAAPVPTADVERRVAALSDAELEEIVQRVAGLVIERIAAALVEKVAWEVVPDLAESLIKDEIRKIKEAV